MAWRILHLDAGRDWRGGQRQVLLLAHGLREHGHEPLVVAPPDSILIQRLRSRGIAASAIRMRADWDLYAARRLRALLRTWRPDVVHAHDARSHAIAMAALAGRYRDIPLIVTRRVAFVPKGRVKYGPRVARFIAISAAVRDALARGGVDPDRVDVVYSGVPAVRVATRRDWRAECRWPASTVLCGIVGAMTAEKGVATINAMGAHMSRAARERTRLLLLGGSGGGAERIGGIEAYRAGFVDDILPAMAGLDVLWHPSRAEGLGTVVIDAMALGVPPVAFAVGGLPELIRDDVEGLLAPPGDLARFAAAAERLVMDPALRQRLAAAGPERAERFDVAHMVRGNEAVYAALLAHHAEPRG